MNLKGLKISNLIVAIGIVILTIMGLIKWYFALLIVIYLLELKIE